MNHDVAVRAALALVTGGPDTRLPALSDDEWRAVREAAERHEIEAPLHDRLARHGRDSPVPGDVRERLAEAYCLASIRSQLAARQLAEVAGALASAGTEAIVLKGMLLAHAVYDDPALRLMSDIDLLVRRPALDDARRVMLGLGYRPLRDEPVEESCRLGHHLPSFVRDGAFPVEIHWSPVRPTSVVRLDLEAMWARSRCIAIGGVMVRCLEPADLLLHLCLHAAHNHRWIGRGQAELPLRAVVDIDRCLRRLDAELDWETLVRRANEAGAGRFAYCALEVARLLAGAPVPAPVTRLLTHGAEDERLVHTICRFLVERSELALPTALRRLVRAGSTGERLRVVAETLLPSPARLRAAGTRGASLARLYREHYGRIVRVVRATRWADVASPRGLTTARQTVRRFDIREWKERERTTVA